MKYHSFIFYLLACSALAYENTTLSISAGGGRMSSATYTSVGSLSPLAGGIMQSSSYRHSPGFASAFSLLPPLTITGGMSAGSYTNGARVVITAGDPPPGKVFARWTGDTEYVAHVKQAETTVTIPLRSITLTAEYADYGVQSGSGNWAVFEGVVRRQLINPDGGKDGKTPALERETVRMLVVTDWTLEPPGNAALIVLGNQLHEVWTADARFEFYDSGAPKRDKAGTVTADRNLVAASIRTEVGRAQLLGTGQWAGKWKGLDLSGQKRQVSLIGAGIGDDLYSGETLRYNQRVSDSMNSAEDGEDKALSRYVAERTKQKSVDLSGDLEKIRQGIANASGSEFPLE